MKRQNPQWLGLACMVLVIGLSAGRAEEYPFVFRNVGEESGALPQVAGIRGHAAAWGDVDANGYPDLFVGTFHNAGSKPAVFLLNDGGKFRPDEQPHLQVSGIGSGALFVDLTNSGRLDLYASHCAHGKEGILAIPSKLFRNDGGGKMTDVSQQSGACPPGYAGRGLSALDFDGDGLLDLVMCEQYYSSKVKTGPALYRNKGNMKFEDVSAAAGMPVGLGGLGVAVGDVNNDTWPDIFLTNGIGNHRLLLNDGKGKYADAPGAAEVFPWAVESEDNTPAGVCIADVNRDGLADIAIGQHFKSPWTQPVAIRLYLNRGIQAGAPKFDDVTESSGIKPLQMKAPHVEFQDFDNDGWPDIYVSVVKFAGNKPFPVIYRNLAASGSNPQFREDAWGVNDWPTAEDKAIRRSGPLFDKILAEKKIIYMAPGPTADFDRDGKMDMFLANWWNESPSLLLKNETPGGNWLDVLVEGSKGVNRMGVGANVKVYPAGKLGDASAMLGCREIAIGYGYCSGQEAVAHFGLAKEALVDVEVLLPHGKGKLQQRGVKANQRLTVKQG